MPTRRTKKLGALIQSELADLILRRVRDPRVRAVSITGVDVSPDLRQAKVYFSPLDAEKAEQAEKGLIAASSFLRRELGARLRLKIIPRLVPVYDSSLAQGDRMDRIIKQVRDQDRKAREAARAHEPEDGEA